ncbi:DUF5706 domain-containing protein [Staphylococcus caprae]|uniref:Pycsar system effector family protein n=1 Tax=Staphylococcus caprae TaxID=29380 RepID=UPI001F598FC1|nr:Pycsar system effector family protein [Staphylococcus caprae]MCI2954777.1 DUF5706 domain-containing protein [Staphylococcus caprae]
MNTEYSYIDTLNRLDNWIARADNKISFGLAFEVFLFGSIISNKRIPNLFNFNKGLICLKIIAILLFVITLIFLVKSLIFFLCGLRAKINIVPGISDKSYLFYGSIKNMNLQSLEKGVYNLSSDDIKKDYLAQIYLNSIICSNKFQNFNKGLTSIYILIAPFLLFNFITLFI